MVRSFCFGVALGLPKVSAAIEADEYKQALFMEHNVGNFDVMMNKPKRVKILNGNQELLQANFHTLRH